jgi:hypothetical protein
MSRFPPTTRSASSQLKSFGECRFRFDWGVLPRCSLCPLFDAQRAIRDVLGENGPAGIVFEIKFDARLRASMSGELPPASNEQLDPDWIAPDFAPTEWKASTSDEPPP